MSYAPLSRIWARAFVPAGFAGSLDGHIPDEFTPTTIGGIGVEEVATMGYAAWTIAIGEQMRRSAVAMEKKAGVPTGSFDRLCGLSPNDDFIMFSVKLAAKPVPMKYRRQRVTR